MLKRLAARLDEVVMGFLALLALCTGFAPLVYPLSPGFEQVLHVVDWVIVGLFAFEYLAGLWLAEDRRQFALGPWRILDAAIVLVALASLFPAIPDAVRASPAFRILRLVRALLFGVRTAHLAPASATPASRPAPDGPPEVTILRRDDAAPRASDWNQLLQSATTPADVWMHGSNLSPERLQEVASAAGVPRVLIEAALHESSYPRIESSPRWTALALSVPSGKGPSRREPVLLLVSANEVLSLARYRVDLQQQPVGFDALSWGPRCALHVIRTVLDRNQEFAGRMDFALRQLEDLPTTESPESFFAQTFRMKRALSIAKGDMWRLHSLLEMLANGRRTLPGLGHGQREALHELAEEADYLHETIEDIRESVLSLIDLHISVAGHDMNRFMRLVAIVSTLALIPAVVGGLLGTNLLDAPFHATLAQVAFGVFVVMLGVLYLFMAKGWLR